MKTEHEGSTLPHGDDPWDGLLNRLGTEPPTSKHSSTGPARDETEPERVAEKKPRMSMLFTRPVVAVATAVGIAAMAFVWLVVLTPDRGDSPTLPNPGRIDGTRQVRRTDLAAPGRPRQIDGREAGRQLIQGERAADVKATRHQKASEGAPRPAPPEPAPSLPSEAPSAESPAPESPPEPSEPAQPPHPSQPSGEAGLVDGSRASAEFGL